MVKAIQDLWIQRSDGIVIFSRVFHQMVEDQLFGALMSALNSFAQEIANGGLNNFEIKNIRFTIIKKKNLIFIANSSKKHKEKKILAELEQIAEKFIEEYPETSNDNWDGCIDDYQTFESKITDKLEDPVKKFWNDF
ncbi:MAG: hypothetical protein ACFE9I_14275 [Candidatus Hermodarchaeota archaeon]